MKPSWDQLMEEFESSETALVADVDCTAEGKPLCNKFGVEGYPTLKYGEPNNLDDYKGARDYVALLEFANKNLGPTCGPASMDLCDDEQKAKIELLIAKGQEQLQIEIAALDQEIRDAEDHFEAEAQKLDALFAELEQKTRMAIASAKDQDLALLKTVRDQLQNTTAEHEEL